MTLKEFVKEFVRPETLIRLWYEDYGTYHAVGNSNLTMENELIEGRGRLSKYANHKVIGLTDIIVLETRYVDAVNIVIEEK